MLRRIFSALALAGILGALNAGSPASADDATLPTLMTLNVAVDVSNVTGDNGSFLIVCKVVQHQDVKQNFLDGHANGTLVHDQVNGQYVAHYKGTIQVPMKEQFVPPAYDFAKLDAYSCVLQMQADGISTWSDYPAINGPLPAASAATSP